MPTPAAAVDQQIVWKNAEMFTFAVSLVAHALLLLDAGTLKFTTDIVPAADRGTGPGVAGSVVTMLKNASLIHPCGVWSHPSDPSAPSDRIFYAERVKSTRPETKTRWIGVYTLTSRSLAEEFLRRSGSPRQPRQPNLV